jgi:hypothetical protein
MRIGSLTLSIQLKGVGFFMPVINLCCEAQDRRFNVWEIEPEVPSTDDLHSVHDMTYVYDVTIRGESTEWDGQRHDLGDLAKLFVGGTLTALRYFD